jgi:hypothetical protein
VATGDIPLAYQLKGQAEQFWNERANCVAYGMTTRVALDDEELLRYGVAANLPGKPTAVTATQTGATTASVALTAPSDNGGSSITGYTATSTPGGVVKTNATSPLLVTGLTTATTYTFAVFATNANGNSQSVTTNSITTA